VVDSIAARGYLVLIPDWYHDGRWKNPTSPDIKDFIQEVRKYKGFLLVKNFSKRFLFKQRIQSTLFIKKG